MLNLKDILNGSSFENTKMEWGKMKITITKDADKTQDVLFLGLFEEDKDNGKSFSKELAEEVEEAISRKAFSRKFGEMYATKLSSHPYKKVVVMGLGERKDLSAEKVRQALGKMVTATKNSLWSSFTTNVVEKACGLDHEVLGRAAAEGLLLANYGFTKYFAKEKQEKKKPLSVVSLQWSGSVKLSEGLKVGRVVAEATNWVRDLVNEPANVVNSEYMENMFTDMAGAAAVMAAVKVAAELKLKKNLLGVMPLCENMVDANAQHPGDIVRACNGKTIEIGNTDAEGRLVLCDALAYTEKTYSPEVMIDLATLTGACVVALGYYAAGVMGKDDELLHDLHEAGMSSGDRVWQLPFFEEYQDWMDGSKSDLNNNSQKGKGYEAGSITAGVFLSKFVEKAKWAHVDIAGSAYWMVDGPCLSRGATGSGVRLLAYYLMENEEKE